MTTWEWTFRDAKVADKDGLTDVIVSIGYTLKGTRGEQSFEIGGETPLGPPNPEDFKPFATLTKDEVTAIVASAVSVDALKAQINAWHDEQIKPLPFEG